MGGRDATAKVYLNDKKQAEAETGTGTSCCVEKEEKPKHRNPRAYKPESPAPIILPQQLQVMPAVELHLARTTNTKHRIHTAYAITHAAAHTNAHVIATLAAPYVAPCRQSLHPARQTTRRIHGVPIDRRTKPHCSAPR